MLAPVIPLLHFFVALTAPGFVAISLLHLLLIYGLLLGLTFIYTLGVRFAVKMFPAQSSLFVLIFNMLKMVISIVLLFAVVVPLTGKGSAVAVNFMIAYMFFLLIDSLLAIIILHRQ